MVGRCDLPVQARQVQTDAKNKVGMDAPENAPVLLPHYDKVNHLDRRCEIRVATRIVQPFRMNQ